MGAWGGDTLTHDEGEVLQSLQARIGSKRLLSALEVLLNPQDHGRNSNERGGFTYPSDVAEPEGVAIEVNLAEVASRGDRDCACRVTRRPGIWIGL